MSCVYVVIDVVDVTDEMFEHSFEEEGTFRTSNDGSQAILTFDTDHPDHMAGKTKYTRAEMSAYLETNAADWAATI